MAGGGSQLKRLKASLRDQGIVGPQQSKKQKRKAAEDVRGRNEKRLQRGVVLDGIREQFNPFDLKHAKGPKFEVTSNRPATNSKIKGRPGEARAAAEENVRPTATPVDTWVTDSGNSVARHSSSICNIVTRLEGSWTSDSARTTPP